MKRFFSLFLSLMLIVSMIPMGTITAFAAWAAPAVEFSSAYDELAGVITVTLTIGEATDIGAFTIWLNYPASKLELIGTPILSDQFDDTQYDTANTSGSYHLGWASNSSAGTDITEHALLVADFKIKDGATGDVTFSLSNYSFADYTNGDEYDTNPATRTGGTVTIVTLLKDEIELTGTVATPTKNHPDTSTLSGSGVDVDIAWDPALSGGKFAGNEEYEVTITVTAAEGYLFSDTASVKLDGYSFEKSGDSFVAKKAFPRTDKKALDTITITSGGSIDVPTADPGETTHATLDLAATGDYDDGSVGVAITPDWSFVGEAPAGVTIEGSALKVSNSAAAGSVTVKAELDGKSSTKSITINKATPVLTSMTIGGGVASIAVPAQADSPYTADVAFTAAGFDQYGKDIATGAVSWSIDPAYSGLSISSDAKLSITNEAAGGTATVKAVAGGVEATKNVRVDKASSKAESVTVSNGVSIFAVPTAAEGGTADTTAFTAEVKDQFGAVMTNPTVVWSIEETGLTGISMNADTGVLTVTKAASAGTITVKATCGGKSGTKSVVITKATSNATTVKLYKDDDDVTGSTQSMVIPKTGTNTADYTAKVFDQFDAEMSAEPTWTIEPAGKGVTVSDGTVSVSTTATAGDYTLKASNGGKDGTLTIKVSAKKNANVTLDNSEITYGETYTPEPDVDTDGGLWTYSYTGIDGTDYGPSSTTPTEAGKYTVTATYESDTHYGSGNATLTIKQKALTISDVTATDREYDGTTVVALTGGNLVGNLDGENVGFTLGTGSITEKNVGNGKEVTTAITLTGTKKDNYTLKQPTDITVDISPKTLQVTYTGEKLTKEYDGSTAYSGEIALTLNGLVASESGTLTAAGGVYNSPNVAEATKLISLGSLTANGFTLSNYSYSLPEPRAAITPKPVSVTISGTAGPVKYGESFAHTASATLLDGDTATYTVKYDGGDKPADVKTYALTATISNDNYSVSGCTGITSFSINKADPAIIASVIKEVRYDDTGMNTLTLDDFGISISGTWTTVAESGTNTILETAPTNGANTLSYQLKFGLTAGDKDKTAVYNLTFTPTESANYNTAASQLTIKVIEKTPITDITVALPSIIYGETLADPVGETAQTGGTWKYYYEGALSDGSDTAFGSDTNETKPTDPGTYTVTAVYENTTHKGSGSTSFKIDKKPLSYTGLSVTDKTYNGTATAEVTGAFAYDGVEDSDVLTAPTYTSAAFADAEVGTNKDVTVSGFSALSGVDAWKYEAPAAYVIKGNIIQPVSPVATGSDAKRLDVNTIEDSYSGYGTDITEIYADAAAIRDALTDEAKKTIPSIGSNIQYYDLQLQTFADGVWSDKDDESVTILFPYPSGTGSSTTFVVVHMKDDGTLETPAMTNGNYGVSVTVDSTSPFAIAWRSRSASSAKDDNYEFWDTVEQKIKRADAGDTIKVNAGDCDRMPWTVMQALRQNNVNLVISWNGGQTITIPAGQALADEAGRIYYPLSYLAEKYKNSAAITAHNMNPETGGVMEITGPVSADINTSVVTPATQGIDEAQAKLEVTPMTPITEAPAITDAPVQQTQTARSSTGILIAVIAAAAALAAGGFLFWRKREEEM